MLEPGFVVTSPRGTVVEILENTPQRFQLKRALPPGTGKTPSHRHDNGIERFRLLEGAATGSVDGTPRSLRPGNVMEVPVGIAHVHPHTDASTTAVVEHTMGHRPARGGAEAARNGPRRSRRRARDPPDRPAWDLGRQVLRQRGLLGWRRAVGVPVRPCLPVAADVLSGAAERQQHEPLGAAIDQLAPDGRGDAHELAPLEDMLVALYQQRERALEHQVDLLLVAVAVDAPSLARLEHDLVHAERADPELSAQREKALADIGVEACGRDSFFHASDAMSSTAACASVRGSGASRR
jgi:mannose-6-phosphate isomerase-like protein (cupin superfamily)